MSKARFDTIESLSTGKQIPVDELFGVHDLSSADVETSTGTQSLSQALDSRVNKGEIGVEEVQSAMYSGELSASLEARLAAVSGREILRGIDIASMPTHKPLLLNEGLSGGIFTWNGSDCSEFISNDPLEGVWIAPNTDPTGSSGAWERNFHGQVYAEWFGAEPLTDAGTEDSTQAFQAASDYAGIAGSWCWSGVHRITGTISIPAQQSFGSFHSGASHNWRSIVATPEDFQGVTPDLSKLDHAVFFDSEIGTAFECMEGAAPHDFTIFGLGLNVLGGDLGDGPASEDFYPTFAFSFPKYIRARNVAATLFQTVFHSHEIVPYSGSYYSLFDNCDIRWADVAFAMRDVPSYNTKVVNCKINCNRFLLADQGVRDFRVIGSSIEGINQESVLKSNTSLSFESSYFETFIDRSLTTYFRASGADSNVSFSNCLIYMNYVRALIRSDSSATNLSIRSMGNVFMLSPSDTTLDHAIYDCSSASPRGALMADTINNSSGNTALYAPGNTDLNTLVHPPVII